MPKPKTKNQGLEKILKQKLDWLRLCFSLREGVTVETIARELGEKSIDYVVELSTGARIRLGPARDVLKYTRCCEAFAEAIGHVVKSKEKSNWSDVAQMIFDVERAQNGERSVRQISDVEVVE